MIGNIVCSWAKRPRGQMNGNLIQEWPINNSAFSINLKLFQAQLLNSNHIFAFNFISWNFAALIPRAIHVRKYVINYSFCSTMPIKQLLKGPLSGLEQLLKTESPLKVIKNAFYFMLKALFVLEIFIFLS